MGRGGWVRLGTRRCAADGLTPSTLGGKHMDSTTCRSTLPQLLISTFYFRKLKISISSWTPSKSPTQSLCKHWGFRRMNSCQAALCGEGGRHTARLLEKLPLHEMSVDMSEQARTCRRLKPKFLAPAFKLEWWHQRKREGGRPRGAGPARCRGPQLCRRSQLQCLSFNSCVSLPLLQGWARNPVPVFSSWTEEWCG